jgi:hypothetical protein
MTKPLIWRISLLVVLAGVLAFAWLVWPTWYRYDRVPWNDSVYSVRINRLTGTTEMLTPYGWRRLGHQEAQTKTSDLPLATLSALTGTAQWHGSTIDLDIYNGTDYEVSEITVQLEVQVKPPHPPHPGGLSDEEVFGLSGPSSSSSRAYRLMPVRGEPCRPLETRRFTADVFEAWGASIKEWHWTIKSAKGVPGQNQ